MFRLIEDVLAPTEIDELHRIAESARFVDGRIGNPHSTVKNNLHLHDEEAHKRCVQILANALVSNEDSAISRCRRKWLRRC